MARSKSSSKSGSLREQFNYYKRRYNDSLIREEAFESVKDGVALSSSRHSIIKRLDYNDIHSTGLTRKVNGRQVRYLGDDAIRVQIQTLKNYSSKSWKNEKFISNYTNTMLDVGHSVGTVEKVGRLLRGISIDKLTIMIQYGLIPSIQYMYAEDPDDEYILTQIRSAKKHGEVSKAEMAKIKAGLGDMINFIKTRDRVARETGLLDLNKIYTNRRK